jgi:antitoxin component YwqK of YwqJK toxin-antitoxin module
MKKILFAIVLFSMFFKSKGQVYLNDLIIESDSSGLLIAILPNEKDGFTGIAIDTFPSGQMKIKMEYINGLTIGNVVTFFENGNVMEKFQYSEYSRKEGCYLKYNDEGELEVWGRYKNDKKQGAWTYLFNGNIIVTGDFDNNMKSGIWRYYDELTGLLFQSIVYENGKQTQIIPVASDHHIKVAKLPRISDDCPY